MPIIVCPAHPTAPGSARDGSSLSPFRYSHPVTARLSRSRYGSDSGRSQPPEYISTAVDSPTNRPSLLRRIAVASVNVRPGSTAIVS